MRSGRNRIIKATKKTAALLLSLLLILSLLPWEMAFAEEERARDAVSSDLKLNAEETGAEEAPEEPAQGNGGSEDTAPGSEEEPAETKEEESDKEEKAPDPAEKNSDQNKDTEKQKKSEEQDGEETLQEPQKDQDEPESGEEQEEDTSATDDWLREISFYNGSTSDTADRYELVPSFDPAEHEYTLYIPDTDSGIYVFGLSNLGTSRTYTTSDGAYVHYTDTRGNDQDVNASMYFEDRNGNYLTRVITKSGEGAELDVYSPAGTKEYIIHLRRITSLMSLKVSFGDEETELFSKGRTSYTVHVPKNCAGETLTITPKAYLYTYDPDSKGNPDYDIRITAGDRQETVSTGEPYEMTLSGSEQTASIRVSYGENRETIYRVKVLPTDNGGAIKFKTDTEDAEDFDVRLYNESGVEVRAEDSDPRLFKGLFIGNTYRYRASYPGYKSISGTIEAESGEVVQTITFREKATGRYLDELKVYPNSSGSVTSNYELTRDRSLDETFGGTVYTIDYSSRMSSDSFYVAASLSDSAPLDSFIRVSAYDTEGSLQEMRLPDSEGGDPIRRRLPGTIFSTGGNRAIYRIKAGTAEDSEEYVILVKRKLELSDLAVMTSLDGDSILEDQFRRSRYQYTASVMKSEEFLFVFPTMYEGDDFTVNVDGDQCDGGYMMVFLMEDHIQQITVGLSCNGTYSDPAYADMPYTSEGEYTVEVERLEPAKVTFETDPEDAVVTLYDRNGVRVFSDAGDNHSYSSLYAGRTYSYVVSLYGCITKVGDFTAVDGDVIRVELDSSRAPEQKDVGNIEWWNYRNSEENNGITDSCTPDDPAKTTEKWAVMIGGDYNSSCTPPIIAGGYVYTAVGKFIYRLDKDTGEILAVSEELAGDVVYALNSMTYAEGMLFVQIGKGRIQAVGCDSLKSIWISEKLGGQTLSPITYKNGYIYSGTWNSETKAGEYFCISVTDEDETRGDETKYCTWRYSHKGGFYWAGAYATDKYVVFGSDDGEREGSYENTACLYSVSAKTGDMIQSIPDIIGDIRTSIVYNSGYIYFATKGGQLYRIKMNDDGTFGQIVTMDLGGMATASPLVYNGRVYIGVAGEGGQFSADGGHTFRVIKTDSSGLHEIYSVEVPGYPQAAALASNAYEGYDYSVSGSGDGRIYIYFTYNAKPGGIIMLTDEPGQTAGDIKVIYEPEGDKQEYCISPIAADSDGTLYYKNDSGYLIAVTSNSAYLRDITLTPSSGEADWYDDFDPAKLKYSIMVDNEAENVAVTLNVPTGRKVTVNGAEYEKGMIVDLEEEGVTLIEVKVTYQGKTRTYKLNVERLGTDASLSAITVSDNNNILASSSYLALSPAFEPETLEYETEEYDGDSRFLNIWPEASGKYAKVQVDAVSGVKKINVFRNAAGSYGKTRYAVYFGDGESEAVVEITVTAGDGKTESRYRVKLRRVDNYPPNLTDIIPSRKSAEEGTVTFRSNESGRFYYTVTGPDDTQPEIPRTEPNELVKGQNVISLTDLGGEAKKVWIIAEDETGNVSVSPAAAILKAYTVFTETLAVKPSDTKVVVTDSDGKEVVPKHVAGADTSTGGSGGAEGSGAETAGKTATYEYDFVEGNTYNVELTRYGYADRKDVILADRGNPAASYELVSIRSSDSSLKGLYASSSGKWSQGLLKLTPSFEKDVLRYEATYDGERSCLNVWPVLSDKKASVRCFAVGGIKASTVNDDETITASTDADGRSYYSVYFADGKFSAEVRIHVVAEDETATDYFVTLNIKDTTAPVISRVSASRISASKASVVFKASEQGKYYYKVVKKDAAAPTIDTSGAGKTCYEGTTTITLTNLKKGSYDVYVVMKDDAGNLSKTIKLNVPVWKGKGGSDEGNTSGDQQMRSGASTSGKLAGDLQLKKKNGKPNDKLKTATKTKKESSAKAVKKGNDSDIDGRTPGKGELKKGKEEAEGEYSEKIGKRFKEFGAYFGGSGENFESVGESVGSAIDRAAALVKATYHAFIILIWWVKALLILAGFGLAYILFFMISVLNRKHTKAVLMGA